MSYSAADYYELEALLKGKDLKSWLITHDHNNESETREIMIIGDATDFKQLMNEVYNQAVDDCYEALKPVKDEKHGITYGPSVEDVENLHKLKKQPGSQSK